MHIDFKITTWERVEIPKEFEQEVLNKVKDGTITSANDIFSIVDTSCNKLENVEEQMTPEENGGCPTLEVWEQISIKDNQPMTCTWQNGNEL